MRDDERVLVDRRVAVAELAGVLDLDRQAGEFLEQVLADDARVVARAAGGEDDPRRPRGAAAASRFSPPKWAVASASSQPAAHGRGDRLRLLEDLLEHVVREARPCRASPTSQSIESIVGVTRACPRRRRRGTRRAVSTHELAILQIDHLAACGRSGPIGSEARKCSPSPTPTTSGLPSRAPTIRSGVLRADDGQPVRPLEQLERPCGRRRPGRRRPGGRR